MLLATSDEMVGMLSYGLHYGLGQDAPNLNASGERRMFGFRAPSSAGVDTVTVQARNLTGDLTGVCVFELYAMDATSLQPTGSVVASVTCKIDATTYTTPAFSTNTLTPGNLYCIVAKNTSGTPTTVYYALQLSRSFYNTPSPFIVSTSADAGSTWTKPDWTQTFKVTFTDTTIITCHNIKSSSGDSGALLYKSGTTHKFGGFSVKFAENVRFRGTRVTWSKSGTNHLIISRIFDSVGNTVETASNKISSELLGGVYLFDSVLKAGEDYKIAFGADDAVNLTASDYIRIAGGAVAEISDWAYPYTGTWESSDGGANWGASLVYPDVPVFVKPLPHTHYGRQRVLLGAS